MPKDTQKMQSQGLNPGRLALGPAFLMTLSPKSEERVRRGAPPPIMGQSPGERELFKGAESRLQVDLCKWKAPQGGSWTGTESPHPCPTELSPGPVHPPPHAPPPATT